MAFPDHPSIDLDIAYSKIEKAEQAALAVAGLKRRGHHNSASYRPMPMTGSSGDIASAVAAIPNDDVDWKTWRDTGLAIWAATGGSVDGLLIFRGWSAKSVKYDEENTEKAWAEFHRSPPDNISAGSLFRRAARSALVAQAIRRPAAA